MKHAVCFLTFILLCGCGNQLRSPVCANTLAEFPKSLQGSFKMVLPISNQFNAPFDFKEQYFEIRKDGIYVANIPEAVSLLGVTLSNLCEIQGEIYFEKLNPNSTYSLAKFEPTQYGLMMNDLTFSRQEMVAAGVPLYYLPSIEFVNDQWQLKSDFGQNPIVYDNRNVSPEALSKLGRISSIRIMFERVSRRTEQMAGISLVDIRRKNLALLSHPSLRQ